MATTTLPPSLAHVHAHTHHPPPPAQSSSAPCPNCNYTISVPPSDAYARIRDLEAQVKLLNSKAAAAVDKLADYEDEVRFLRAVHARSPKTKDAESPRDTIQPSADLQVRPAPQQQMKYPSFSSFLPGRRASPALQQPPTPSTPMFSFGAQREPLNRQFSNASTPNLAHPQPSPPPAIDLSAQLASEHAARVSAEKTLSTTQTELEELTAQLFGQANEMVAAERKARVRLEERVKVLEKRDGEKRNRLERLEKAVERIERVRRMVR